MGHWNQFLEADEGMSMEEAMARQSELEDCHRKTQLRLEELQEKLREHQDRLQGYKNRKLELSRQELEVCSSHKRLISLYFLYNTLLLWKIY